MFDLTRHQLIAAAVIVIVVLVGTGVLVTKSGVFRSSEIKFIEPGASADGPSEAEQPRTFCIHVAGKVNKPGVYDLKPGSRVKDAIEMAGGAVGDADLETINLAEELQDGQQVYIAPKGQNAPPTVSVVRGGSRTSVRSSARPGAGRESSSPTKLTTPGQGTVNINTAGLRELQRLPGIGPAMAQRIIDYRNQNGRFDSVDELDEVRGIGPAKLAKMRPFVTI